jgi:hypothetical protein
MAKDNGTPMDMKYAINKELLQYIAPKLKAMDLSGSVELDHKVEIISFKDATQEDVDGYHGQ